MKKTLESRLNILVMIIIGIFLAFTLKLAQYQIIDGEEYYSKSNASTRINQTVIAARGDITDINGVSMAGGQVVFDITINKAYMPSEKLNERILQVVKILQQQGETLNDILPISREKPYTFIEGKEAEQTRLREDVAKVAVYATEQDVLTKLTERYKLQDVPQDYVRTIAGIRYTMEREGYSASYPFDIAKDVSVETATIIQELSRELTGIEVTESSKRYYANGTLLPHILGTVGPIYAEEYRQLKSQGYGLNDTLGKSGLEKVYESYLKGTDGVLQIEKNIYGEITDVDTIIQPKPGNTVKLTIDAEFQQRANDILKAQVEMLQSRTAGWGKECTGATMVVLDVKTGGVLAISNYPSYDLERYNSNYSEYFNDPDTPLFNRAVQGLYRPGSVFKVNMAVAALQMGLIDENFTYTCRGVYDYYTVAQWGGRLPSCANNTAHGTINVKQALKVSCNCFFYDLGRRMGIERINESAHNMGLGVLTGLEISEQLGRLSTPEFTESLGGTWQAGNVIQASIGQLDTAITAVQLATYAGTVANRGVRYATHIVDSIESYDGSQVIYKTPVTVLSETPNTNNAFDIAEQGMVMASTEGNAKIYLQDLPYTVASKTGTAQVAGDLYNATIMAYGPTENPEIAVAIIAEKGGNGYNLAMGVRDVFNAYYEIKAARGQ
ncbi:MAG: hypothetical protein IKK99_08020 [Oscillospiraceae bacterium]|nr:hypothetical protein [Oscillospiraceae bacterium]